MGRRTINGRQVALALFLIASSMSVHVAAQANRVQGQWRTDRPDQGVIVTLTIGSESSIVIPGHTRGRVEALTMALRNMRLNAEVATFSTDLPDNEGAIDWEFRVTAADSGVLRVVRVAGEPAGDDMPRWTLRRN
jgi:hypothetical protein